MAYLIFNAVVSILLAITFIAVGSYLLFGPLSHKKDTARFGFFVVMVTILSSSSVFTFFNLIFPFRRR